MKSRWLYFAAGGIAFVLGIGLLSFGAYNAFIKDDSAPVSDAPIVDAGSIVTASPAPATEVSPTPTPLPPLGAEPYNFVIDKLGINNPVRAYGLDEEAVPEIPTGDDAASVVAWYDFSAPPGVGSNAVFAGHVTWFGEAVFFRLPEMVKGDDIKLVGQDGTTLTYRIRDIFRVAYDDPHARDVMFGTHEDLLTLITCDGVFTPDPDDHISGGNYDNRLVIQAELLSVTPGAG